MNQLPFNDAFENAVIVAILSDPRLLTEVNQVLSDQDFFKFSNQEIYKTLNTLPIEEIDSLVIQNKLSVDAKEHLDDLIRQGDSLIPSLSNFLVYAEEIKSKSVLRQCIKMGQEIASIGYRQGINSDEALSELESRFAQFIYTRVQDNRGLSTRDAFEGFLSELGKIKDGTKTGFTQVDLILHHLENLIVLGAKPGVGKTAYAINISRNIAETHPVLFFSLEQSQDQIFERLLAAEAQVSLEDIRTGAFIADVDAVRKINLVKHTLSNVMRNIHVDERAALSAAQIMSTARQKKVEWGHIGLIVVDYLHILSLNDKMRVESLGDATRELRALSKEVGAPVLLLAQLSRHGGDAAEDDKKPRRPVISDLRGSGEIEANADVIMFLYRESYYNLGYSPDVDTVEVLIEKNRSGRTGIALLDWLPKYVKFRNSEV